MSVATRGYLGNTNGRFGKTQYQYECRITERTMTKAHVVLRVRLMLGEGASISGSVRCGALVGFEDGPGTYQQVTIAPSNLRLNQWGAWVTVFNGYVDADVDDAVLYVYPCVWMGGYSYNYRAGALGGGLNFGSSRPTTPTVTSLSPKEIGVAYQDTFTVTLTWRGSSDSNVRYRVYVSPEKGLNGAKTVAVNLSGNSLTFNPKQYYFSGDWHMGLLRGGDKLYFGVEAWNGEICSTGIGWSDALTYTEIKALAPDEAYIVGWSGVKNEIMYKGEKNVTLCFGGYRDGSYGVEGFNLVPVSAGGKIYWFRTADVKTDANGSYYTFDMDGVKEQNSYVQYELRAYDTKGEPVYMTNGSNLRFSVKFCGGVLSVYGKSEDLGDEVAYRNLDEVPSWHDGLTWVYDGSTWRKASEVSVYNGEWVVGR